MNDSQSDKPKAAKAEHPNVASGSVKSSAQEITDESVLDHVSGAGKQKGFKPAETVPFPGE